MRQKRAFALTAALHKYTAEPLVCPAAAEIATVRGTLNKRAPDPPIWSTEGSTDQDWELLASRIFRVPTRRAAPQQVILLAVLQDEGHGQGLPHMLMTADLLRL
jgi:hypothetical protein